MSSVTGRIAEIKQPRGGYLKPSLMEAVIFNDNKIFYENENIHPSIIGLAVDYLTRFIISGNVTESFGISIEGARIAEKLGHINNSIANSQKLISQIKGIDNDSIIAACKLVSYDVWIRNPNMAIFAKGPHEINPNNEVVRNIKTMIERTLYFFEKQKQIIADGFTFECNGYTKTVNCGDGDILTEDTLIDLKVSKSKPTSKNTLQILMYWIMGQHSGQKIFKNIKTIGIFNPRLNIFYKKDISDIPEETIKLIEKDVICY